MIPQHEPPTKHSQISRKNRKLIQAPGFNKSLNKNQHKTLVFFLSFFPAMFLEDIKRTIAQLKQINSNSQNQNQ